MVLPQIESVTTLARDFKSVLAKLAKGPVFIAQRSEPAAVVLSVNDYEKITKDQEELKRLRRIVKADQARVEPVQSFTSPDQLLAW
ncbi:MAG: type II toxin-antitoxin system prevent-host-death family antitoxin [Caldilineaceae bacterium]